MSFNGPSRGCKRWIGTGGSVLGRVCPTDMCVCVCVDMAVCFTPVPGPQLTPQALEWKFAHGARHTPGQGDKDFFLGDMGTCFLQKIAGVFISLI